MSGISVIRLFLPLMLAAFLLSGASRVFAEKKRDEFRYHSKTDSFKMKDDWFGNRQKTRKQMEMEAEEKKRKAMEEEKEREQASLTNEEINNTGEAENHPSIKSHRIKDGGEQVRSEVKTGAVINGVANTNRPQSYDQTASTPIEGTKTPSADSTSQPLQVSPTPAIR